MIIATLLSFVYGPVQAVAMLMVLDLLASAQMLRARLAKPTGA